MLLVMLSCGSWPVSLTESCFREPVGAGTPWVLTGSERTALAVLPLPAASLKTPALTLIKAAELVFAAGVKVAL